MINNDAIDLLTTMIEIHSQTVKMLEASGIETMDKVDIVMTKLFISFFVSSILNLDESKRKEYIHERLNYLSEELGIVTGAVMSNNFIGDLVERNGGCACDKCRTKTDKEDVKPTIH